MVSFCSRAVPLFDRDRVLRDNVVARPVLMIILLYGVEMFLVVAVLEKKSLSLL